VDLAFRIRLQGGGCVYLPDAVVEHVGSAITGLHSDFQLYHGHRNLLRVFVANMPSALFWPCLPLHLLMHVAALCWFSVKGRAGVMWRAKRDALRSLPAAWRRRRVVQAGRRISARRLWRVLHKGLPRVDRDG
jgi:GT2 family glycosyltransferase